MTVRAPIVERTAETAVTLALKAPLSGFLMPNERVPDPVFAQKMVGDGIAVDPTSQSLLAPCEGEVVMLHPANHALTLMTPEGAERATEQVAGLLCGAQVFLGEIAHKEVLAVLTSPAS